METVQGYVILKAATFETGHGFALGHNPGAPSPFVTWQFTEGENGHRDYYWGRYGTSQAWAQRDFDRRVDDYQQLYHAAVKHTELGPEGVYRYYSTQRPVDMGTYPKPPDNQPLSIVNYDDDRRRPVADGRLMAWGELTYAKPLTEKQMEDYELKPAPGNPDRVRPSITARLKEGTKGQEPPKEPDQKRSHKNHEERCLKATILHPNFLAAFSTALRCSAVSPRKYAKIYGSVISLFTGISFSQPSLSNMNTGSRIVGTSLPVSSFTISLPRFSRIRYESEIR